MLVKKTILIGLIVVFGILYVPTPQRPDECGGGSVLWRKQSSVENAEYMKQQILAKMAGRNSQSTNMKNLYWDKRSDGRVVYCIKNGNYSLGIWVFDSDRPNAMIVEESRTGSVF